MRENGKCVECKNVKKSIHSKYFCEDCLVEFISVEKHANDLERMTYELDELKKGEDTYLFVIRRQKAEIELIQKECRRLREIIDEVDNDYIM